MTTELDLEYDRIYRYCYYKVRNKETAEDITQETFLKYFSDNLCIKRGKDIAFLYTVAKNLCIDYFRKVQSEELDEDIQTKEDIEINLDSIVLKDAVKNLPEELSEILLLRYANELHINEIADYLGISRFAVNRRLKSAVKEIKNKIRREDFYE